MDPRRASTLEETEIEIRTLQPCEREALLDLLDGWPLGDGWSGREFFRRYVELDPSYEDRNVWVAVERGRLVACVQIFPRLLRAADGGTLSCGGIGSVFTDPGARRRGLAAGLLAAATDAMRERDMQVSLLLAARISWYESMGWRTWCRRRRVFEPAGTGPMSPVGVAPRVERVDQGSDLAPLARLAATYAAGLPGTVVRDDASWRASLDLAGNPTERFVVRGSGSEPVALLRSTLLGGRRQLTEWAYREGAVDQLVPLIVDEVERNGRLVGPPVPDPLLDAALLPAGIEPGSEDGPAWMLRCLDPDRLRARFRGAQRSDDQVATDEALLEAALPRSRFGFWTADRF